MLRPLPSKGWTFLCHPNSVLLKLQAPVLKVPQNFLPPPPTPDFGFLPWADFSVLFSTGLPVDPAFNEKYDEGVMFLPVQGRTRIPAWKHPPLWCLWAAGI